MKFQDVFGIVGTIRHHINTAGINAVADYGRVDLLNDTAWRGELRDAYFRGFQAIHDFGFTPGAPALRQATSHIEDQALFETAVNWNWLVGRNVHALREHYERNKALLGVNDIRVIYNL